MSVWDRLGSSGVVPAQTRTPLLLSGTAAGYGHGGHGGDVTIRSCERSAAAHVSEGAGEDHVPRPAACEAQAPRVSRLQGVCAASFERPFASESLREEREDLAHSASAAPPRALAKGELSRCKAELALSKPSSSKLCKFSFGDLLYR